MSNMMRGILAMVAACTIWGLSPLYYALVAHVPAQEVLGHRVLWSLAFFGVFLGLQGRLGQVRRVLATGSGLGITLLATLMISCNWWLFISAVGWGMVRESALGYYIFPLLAVLLGVVAGERLHALQWVAVGLAVLAIGILSLAQGGLPWIALVLAVTFAAYGLLKKGALSGPVVSVTAEVVLIAPLAVMYLAVAGTLWDLGTMAVLVVSGPLTAVPLILFSAATRRIDLSMVGILQYINPTLQFLAAVIFLGEPMTGLYLAVFGLIWAAVALYSAAAFSRRAKASGTVSTTQT